MQLKSNDLLLTVSTESPSFKLESLTFPGASLQSSLDIVCRVNGEEKNLFDQGWQIEEIEENQTINTRFGTLTTCRMTTASTVEGVRVVLLFGLSAAAGMAFLQMDILNDSVNDLTLRRIDPLMVEAGNLQLNNPGRSNPVFYSQGWQSWSATAAYGLGEKQRTSILGRFQNPMVVNSGTPQPKQKNRFTGDMFGVLGDRSSRIGLLAGFLSSKVHFGSLEAEFKPEPSLKMWANGDDMHLPAGSTLRTDWVALGFIHLDDPDPMGVYLQAAAQENNVKADQPVPVGWCSWYNFYQNITQENMQANLDSLIQLKPDLPLPLFQIDDGFETYPGDWYDFDPGFPEGLTALVQNARANGFTPGLWLAPFIIHPKARLVGEHPDWLLRDGRGKPVNAGFVWNAFTYALDLTNPDALAYTYKVIRTAVEEWGFEYLKLDFLYAAALNGVYQDPTRSRAQVLRKGLEALREAAGPDVTMLACGCPLGSALGLFEAMRISADVNSTWKPHFPPVSLILQNEPHMPAARNALYNILTRASIHNRWWINDPDCLLIRPDTELTLAEVQTLASAIGLTGGSLLLSDDLPALPKDRLKMAQVLLPVIGKRPRVLDAFDEVIPTRLRVDLEGSCGAWHLLAWFNWTDQPQSFSFSQQAFSLPEEDTWWLREFWTGEIGRMRTDSPYTFNAVPAHGVRIAAVKRYDPDQPAYLGSDLHLSQGLEVNEWRAGENELSLRFNLGHTASGRVFLYLPWESAGAWFKGEVCPIKEEDKGIYSLELVDADGQELAVK